MNATELMDAVRSLRLEGDPGPLMRVVPFTAAMGMSAELREGRVLAKLPFQDFIIGNNWIKKLHGGTLASLLESTAMLQLLTELPPETELHALPQLVSITFDFVRGGEPFDSFARATIERMGRRVARVRAVAWQEDESRLVTSAQAQFLLP